MVSIDDARTLAMGMPEAWEKPAWGMATWRVDKRMFVWERPLRSTDLAELGDAAPDGPILGVHVDDLGEKEALLASEPDVYFTTSHFDGHPTVLVRLDAIDLEQLREIVTDAWLSRAPKRLFEEFRAGEQ